MPRGSASTTIDWSEPGIDRRLAAAIVCANSDGDSSTKNIAKLFGKGATESAISNQMKKIRALGKKLKEAAGDISEVPVSKTRKRKTTNGDEFPPSPKKGRKSNTKAPATIPEFKYEVDDVEIGSQDED